MSQEDETPALWVLWKPLREVKVGRWALVWDDWVMWRGILLFFNIMCISAYYAEEKGWVVGFQGGLFFISSVAGFSGSDRSKACSWFIYRACGDQFGLRVDRVFKCGPSGCHWGCFVRTWGVRGGKFSCVDLGGLGSVFMCVPARAHFTGWSWGRDYVRFLRQGACCVYCQNIVDFLSGVLDSGGVLCAFTSFCGKFWENCEFSSMFIWCFPLRNSFCCRSRVWLFSVFYICQVLQGAWRYFELYMGFGGVHVGGGGSVWLGRELGA